MQPELIVYFAHNLYNSGLILVLCLPVVYVSDPIVPSNSPVSPLFFAFSRLTVNLKTSDSTPLLLAGTLNDLMEPISSCEQLQKS